MPANPFLASPLVPTACPVEDADALLQQAIDAWGVDKVWAIVREEEQLGQLRASDLEVQSKTALLMTGIIWVISAVVALVRGDGPFFVGMFGFLFLAAGVIYPLGRHQTRSRLFGRAHLRAVLTQWPTAALIQLKHAPEFRGKRESLRLIDSLIANRNACHSSIAPNSQSKAP